MRSRTIVACLVAAFLAAPLFAKDDWLPIPPADLAMKDNPAAPGAPAMILHREVFTDNVNDFETNYTRIKIFTDEGKKYADVEIPYFRGLLDIRDIKARTIQPDGSIVVFNGRPFDKLVVKSRWVKIQAKTITLPDVRAGSIIEYKYTYSFENRLFAPTWDVQDELAIRHLKCVLHPYGERSLRWIVMFLPKDAAKEQKNHDIVLEMNNIPALQKEDYMPPESTLKSRVEFFYTSLDKLPAPAEFWKEQGKQWFAINEPFIGNRGAIAREAAAVAPASDQPEVRLKKLYDRAQQIRNLSYEEQKTEKEQNREKLKDNNNVEDVLKRGYAYRSEINRFFVALARAAGFDAQVVRVSERDTYFFREGLQNGDQLDGEIALVRRINGKDLYLDPATPFCPYGLLSWERTGVQGLLPTKDGGTLISTTQPASRDALTERKAAFRLSPDGDLEGKLELTFYGQEALQRRLEARTWDDEARRKDLQQDIKAWMPSGATVTVDGMSGWKATDEPLHISATLKVAGYAAATGRRMMLPRSMFQGSIGQPFRNATRVHPVYFDFPWSEADEITIALPPGYSVENPPRPQQQQLAFGTYQASTEAQGNTVTLRRRMSLDGLLFRVEYYPMLKAFFDQMRAGDEEQLVLRGGGTATGK